MKHNHFERTDLIGLSMIAFIKKIPTENTHYTGKYVHCQEKCLPMSVKISIAVGRNISVRIIITVNITVKVTSTVRVSSTVMISSTVRVSSTVIKSMNVMLTLNIILSIDEMLSNASKTVWVSSLFRIWLLF